MKNDRFPAVASSTSPGSSRRLRSSSSNRSTAVPIASNVAALSGCVSFSAPTARATSTAPEPTAMQASENALEAEAQAFSTLTMGIPSSPVWRRATCPRIISWPVRMPAVALAKNAIPMSSGRVSASASASRVASSASDRIVLSTNLPNRVIAAPATTTSRIRHQSARCRDAEKGPRHGELTSTCSREGRPMTRTGSEIPRVQGHASARAVCRRPNARCARPSTGSGPT